MNLSPQQMMALSMLQRQGQGMSQGGQFSPMQGMMRMPQQSGPMFRPVPGVTRQFGLGQGHPSQGAAPGGAPNFAGIQGSAPAAPASPAAPAVADPGFAYAGGVAPQWWADQHGTYNDPRGNNWRPPGAPAPAPTPNAMPVAGTGGLVAPEYAIGRPDYQPGAAPPAQPGLAAAAPAMGAPGAPGAGGGMGFPTTGMPIAPAAPGGGTLRQDIMSAMAGMNALQQQQQAPAQMTASGPQALMPAPLPTPKPTPPPRRNWNWQAGGDANGSATGGNAGDGVGNNANGDAAGVGAGPM